MILRIGLLWLLATIGSATAMAEEDNAVPYEIDRVTIPVDDVSLVGLAFHAPAGGEPQPAVLLLHGWAPEGTNGAGIMSILAFEFQQAGYYTLALSMRGWPDSGGVDDCGGLQARDVLKVVEWLGKQPHVDADRIALVGHSQGGQVALLANGMGASVQAVVAYAPTTDLKLWRDRNPGIKAYVDSVCSQTYTVEQRSPALLAAQMRAPVLLLHGTGDDRVQIEQSERLMAAMEAVKKPVTLVSFPNAGHHWSEIGGSVAALRFLDQVLR